MSSILQHMLHHNMEILHEEKVNSPHNLKPYYSKYMSFFNLLVKFHVSNEHTKETCNFVEKSVKIPIGLAQCLDNFDGAPPSRSPAE